MAKRKEPGKKGKLMGKDNKTKELLEKLPGKERKIKGDIFRGKAPYPKKKKNFLIKIFPFLK